MSPLWVVVALFVLLVPSVARAQPREEPTIVGMRVGLKGTYKLGCWTPIEVDLLGGTKQFTGRVLITAPDGDGVPTTVATPASRPVGVNPGEQLTARLYVRVGRTDGALRAAFLAEGKIRAERTFQVGSAEDQRYITGGLSASSRLVVQFGPSLGIGELVKSSESQEDLTSTFVAQLTSADQLPTRWYGYEGVDTVLLTTSEVEAYRPLLQSETRVEALRQWVERGGRVAIFCSREAEELLGENGVLSDFAPGKLVTLAPLRRSQPIEAFSGSEQALSKNRRVSLQVPKFEEVTGSILAYSGSEPSELPLVIRSRLGLGEVVFVGLDIDRQPFQDWKGRTAFLKKALEWPDQSKPKQQSYAYSQGTDTIARLRSALDSKFQGVTTIPFSIVGILVVGYILLIGPGDYFLVSRIFKRHELTWLTFPLMVIGVSVGAYFLANWLKGDQFRVNQVEIVDVDTVNNRVRGTVWTHFFSPRVETFDLSVEPSFLGSNNSPLSEGEKKLNSDRLVSWLGMPGYGQGGMQNMSGNNLLKRGGYRFNDQLSAMKQVPVQLWSTKTLTAEWQAEIESPLTAQLSPEGDDLLSGQLTNNSSVLLEDAILCYGSWAYYLGRIAPDAIVSIDGELQPKTVRTSLTAASSGEFVDRDSGYGGYDWTHYDVARLVKSMMFFDAINGEDFTSVSNRYQDSIDLSHLLKQKSVAILLTRVSIDGSHWLDEDRPLKSEADRKWTYYRFIFPVQRTSP